MIVTRRALVKAAFAVVVGVPGTLVFVPVIALALVTFVTSVLGVMIGNTAGSAPVRGALLALVWSAGGLAGLIGFWAWVFMRPGAPPKARVAIACCIGAGMCAVAPFALGGELLGGLALIGLAAGAAIGAWLVFPAAPLNPDMP